MVRFLSKPHNKACWRSIVRLAVAAMLASCLSAPSAAQQFNSTERAQIDNGALAVLDATGAPSASIAIVRGGEIVYERAYGDGRIAPKTPATPSMRYAIGSVSKQFTATALLLLEEEGRLSLHDKVGEVVPAAYARERRQRAATTVDDVGIPGLLAAGLRLHRHAAPRDGADDYAAVGCQGAGFRPRREVAIQQHQLRDRGGDRRAGGGYAVR